MTDVVGAPDRDDPSEFDPRTTLNSATAALTALCGRRFEAFGTAGRAANPSQRSA